MFVVNDKRFMKITRNQLQILDALMSDGGYVKKYLDTHRKLRYSEHFGMLDFNEDGLEKVIVSGRTERVDEDDHEILLPDDVPEALDYEYMFHTHPPTPSPGARAKEGILYEFPSINDVYHFAEHFNQGRTQGSIIVAPEGLYLIRARKDKTELRIPDSEQVFHAMVEDMLEIQARAIDRYGIKVSERDFYAKVAKDTSYIRLFNKMLEKHWGKQLVVHYRARKYDGHTRKWYLPGFLLPVSVVEPRKV